MNQRLIIITLPILLFIVSCSQNNNHKHSDAVVQVDNKVLTLDNVEAIVPDDATRIDSADIADKYIQEWVYNELILKRALINIGDDPDIDKLVNEYRNSLLISKYMELLVSQKADIEISDQDITDYYHNHTGTFNLNNEILRGVYLKIPTEAPRLNQLKEWIRNRSEDDMLELEDYCFQNARRYEDFRDKWMSADVASKYMAEPLNEAALSPGVTIEQVDSLSRYYLLIFDVKRKGEPAPLTYVRSQIVKILKHQKRLDFIASFKKDILNEAIRNKNVIYYEPH